MPLYSQSPFQLVPLAKAGTPIYLFGFLRDTEGPTKFLITKSEGNGTTTVTGTIIEGKIPRVGELITIIGATNPDLQVTATPITAVHIGRVSGIGTISFASGNEPPQPQPITEINWYDTGFASCTFGGGNMSLLDDDDVIIFDGFVDPNPALLNKRSFTIRTGHSAEGNYAEWTGWMISIKHNGPNINYFYGNQTGHFTIGNPPTASPAVALIPRSPVLEKVQKGYKSIAVALSDDPQGRSIQNFSIDVAFSCPGKVPDFDIGVEVSNDNNDCNFREVSRIMGFPPTENGDPELLTVSPRVTLPLTTMPQSPGRFETGCMITANFVRLHINEIADNSKLAARLLIR